MPALPEAMGRNLTFGVGIFGSCAAGLSPASAALT